MQVIVTALLLPGLLWSAGVWNRQWPSTHQNAHAVLGSLQLLRKEA